jgi:amidophosphoribosyltransferase
VYVTGDITEGDIDRMNQQRVKTDEGEAEGSRLTLPNAFVA